MPPQQPNTGYGPPSMPVLSSQGANQFDFIVAPNPGRPSGQLTNANTGMRIIIVVGGILGLLLLVWVFFSIISHQGTINTATLLPITQQQNELYRISLLPGQQATDQSTENFAETTYLSLVSDQVAIINFMKLHGTKAPSAKVLAAKRSTTTDTTLQQAQTTGTYDSTYISIAQTQLTSYEHALSQAYTTTKSISEKQILQTAYHDAQLLLQMSTQN